LRNSILDINNVGNYNYLILCIDADENSIEERQHELEEYLEQFKNDGVELSPNCKLELIVQNRCIETWFLGNKIVYKTNPSSSVLLEFQNFYNVQDNDPELMSVFKNFGNHASFHFAYLRKMLLERNIKYSKNYPRSVAEKPYLERLIERGEMDNHILSFMNFYNLCKKIKEEIK